MVPISINTKNNCSTHVPFDNYDRFVETLDGNDMLHDTVGIIFQFKIDHEVTKTANIDSEVNQISLTFGDAKTQEKTVS